MIFNSKPFVLNMWQKYLFKIKIFFAKFYSHNINTEHKILVVLHLYYMEAWPLIKMYLEQLNKYDWDLVVTYVKDNYTQKTLNDIRSFKNKGKVIFHEYPNKGYDVGPFVDIITNHINITEYDVIFKLHSKSCWFPFRYIYRRVFCYNDWFMDLYSILDPLKIHKVINILSNNHVDIIANKNLLVNDPEYKRQFLIPMATKYGIVVPQNYKFVAGTCFAISPKCLNSIIKLKLSINDFQNTERGEYSLAHAMERIICINKNIIGINVLSYRRHIFQEFISKLHDPARLLNDKKIKIDSEFFYKYLESKKLIRYTIKKIAIKNINRLWVDNKIYKLSECSPYLYLKNKDEKRYIKYCEYNAKVSRFNMSKDRFDNLINSLNKNFDSTYMPIVNQNYIVLDGQHRLCYLLNKYGPEYKVKCCICRLKI